MGIGWDNQGNEVKKVNAIPYLAYFEIYKNYYAFKQSEVGAIIYNSSRPLTIWVTDIEAYTSDILPIYPGTSNPIPFTSNSNFIIITKEPGYTDIWGNNDLLKQLQFSTNIGQKSLLDLFTFNNENVNQLKLNYNYTANGQIIIYNWLLTTDFNNTKQIPNVVTFPLSNIDEMRDRLLKNNNAVAFDVRQQWLTPYSIIMEEQRLEDTNLLLPIQRATQGTQNGLCLKTYQSDLNNNWLNTEWLDGIGGINDITSVDTSNGKFEINQLILAKKVFNMLNQIAVSGGSYNDWLDAVYGNERMRLPESPIYHGGLSKEIIFQEVVSNSAAQATESGGAQPLGTLAGRGVNSSKHKGGNITINVQEPSYIIGIVSITPRLDYSQGNKWDIDLQTMDDLHKPHLDQIGFQDLLAKRLAWWAEGKRADNGNVVNPSVGKQPAWINYMTEVNEVRGNFAIKNNEGFMVLNRNYEWKYQDKHVSIKDATVYVDPVKYNDTFAIHSIDAMNFWVQISNNIYVRRKMSSKVMPNL